MAVEVIDLDAITKVINDDKTPTIELIRIMQQLVAAIRDHEARLVAGGL